MNEEIGTGTSSKPGYKTTEFWLTSVVTLVGLLLASGAIAPEGVIYSWLLKIVGILTAAGSASVYAIGRSAVKK